MKLFRKRRVKMSDSVRMRTQSEIEEDVKRLEEWLMKQPHLPKDVEGVLLRAFVHGTKGLEIAKQKLDSYFCCRTKAPQLFSPSARDPMSKEFKESCKAAKVFLLPTLTPESHVVFVVSFDLDFSKFDHDRYVSRLMMMLELALLRWPDNDGLIFLADVGGVDSSILTKASISSAAFFLSWFQRTMPVMLKKAVVVNTPKFFEMLINTFFKPFLSKKIVDRITLTSDGIATLQNYVPKEMLPCDFDGGSKSSSDLNGYWLEELERKREWLLKSGEEVSEEAKRSAKAEGSYGVDGTFRSLKID